MTNLNNLIILRFPQLQPLIQMDTQVYQYLEQYFKSLDMYKTAHTLHSQFNNQHKKKIKNDLQPKLNHLLKSLPHKTKKQTLLEKEYKQKHKKYKEILQAGRQIFSVAINLLQMLHGLKEASRNQSISETIQNYKIQLGKNHKIIINQGKPEGNQLITENVIIQHKHKLQRHVLQGNDEGIIQIFLSLRVNALQIAPQLRKTLVCELIKKDIFKITQTGSYQFALSIIDNNNKSLRHAITSLISVLSSSIKGVEYITQKGMKLIGRIIKIMKQQQNGNITQRFCLAILQKSSIKQIVIGTYLQQDMIEWILTLVKKSFLTQIHTFCLDFATAMLANIVHAKRTIKMLQTKPDFTKKVPSNYQLMDTLLKFIRQKMPVSVLMHLLIALSYLSRASFKQLMEQISFLQRISDFVEYYNHINTGDNEAAQIDKKTVLDLCSHMFHPKTQSESIEEQQQKIIEYQNEQCELIFECFQDEVN